MPRTLNTLQVGRACAALSVLLYHTEITLSSSKYLGHVIFPFFNAGKSGIDFFFVLSGFVIIIAHNKDVGNPSEVLTFFWKRFRRIYPPLWVALIIVIPVFFLFPQFGYGPERSISTIIQAFLVTPAPNDYLLATEWTLRHEMIFYFLFAIIILNVRAGFVTVLFFTLASICSIFTNYSFPISFIFSIYNILFLFGGIAAHLYIRHVKILSRTSIFIGLFSFALTWIMIWLNALNHDASATILLFGASSAMIIFGASTLESNKEIALPRFLIYLGEASYSIYLVHFPVVSLLAKIVVLLDRRILIPGAIAFILVAVSALAAGIIFHIVIEKPAVRLVSRLPAVLNRKTDVAGAV